jgi:histidyl-tRNA synthetase
MDKIKAPRGAPDVLPPTSELLAEVEGLARTLFDRYGYRRIDVPVFEQTELFVRSVGEGSDIVRKEMYSFTDRSGRPLTLRPEGTASVVRAFVEHRLDGSMPLPVRLSYLGPMFRYERPQSGRNRQFLQAGVECIGSSSPVVDAEVILLGTEFFKGLRLGVELLLNTMGCAKDQAAYGPHLVRMLDARFEDLCPDCHERLKTNPLRVFDCKVPECQALVRSADIEPINELVCDDCREHHEHLQQILEAMGVAWRDAPDLVRGLDYYTRTIFEFDLSALGARSAVCGGGRYDGLVEELGGPALPAVGLAIGIEPTMVALRGREEDAAWKPDVCIMYLSSQLAPIAMALARDLRAAGKRVIVTDDGTRSLKSQLRTADRTGARRAVILGPDEMQRGVATVRDLESKSQEEVPLGEVVAQC